ncbi:MAG: ankyrin repeat domain-containing protein [Candidatus Zixiibacteriota bacterium]
MKLWFATALVVACLLAHTTHILSAEIHDAIKSGDISKVREVLEQDISQANAPGPTGGLPLHSACYSGQAEIVALLLNAGADVNRPDQRGFAPLQWAIHGCHGDIVGLLLEHGAETQLNHPVFGKPVDQAFQRECQRNSPPVITSLLISHGVPFDPNEVDSRGMPRLFWTAIFGNTEMARFLIERGAIVDIVREHDGRTPLAEAVSRGHSDIAALFLNNYADPNSIDKEGDSPLCLAVKSGLAENVRMLLSAGANPAFVEKLYGRNLLHLAAIRGYFKISAILVEAGCSVGEEDEYGQTPLCYAARYGHQTLANYFVEQGAKPTTDMQENYGKPELLSKALTNGEAAIWYLNNRGWAVKTQNHMLIFDYEQYRQILPAEPSLTNGFVTLSELSEQNVCGIYTCYHGEPGELELIHTLEDSLESAIYIHNADDPWRGCTNTVYLKPNESFDNDDIFVKAVRPTSEDYMPTNAYLCTVDGLAIYYAGDTSDDLALFRSCLDTLAEYTDMVDIAFLPVPEPGEEENSDLKLFLERFTPRAICLMDPNRRNHLLPDVARNIAGWGVTARVFCAENPGDNFLSQPSPY